MIADDFEHDVVGWQCEHFHHHALDAPGALEQIVRGLQMLKKRTVTFGLTLLRATERRVNLIHRFARREAE